MPTGATTYVNGESWFGVYQVRGEVEMEDLLERDPAKDLLRFEVVLPMGGAVVGSPRRELDG